jgi:hypothetical protein
MARKAGIKRHKAAVKVRKPVAPPSRVHKAAKTYARAREQERLRQERQTEQI